MRVVHPHHRAAIHWAWSGTRGNGPHVHISTSGGHGVIHLVAGARPIVVWHALGALLVEHAVRMNAEGAMTVVPKHHADRVANHGMKYGTKEAEMLPFRRARLEGLEAAIGVFAIENLLVLRAHLSRARSSEKCGICVRLAGDLIATSRDVIPCHRIGGDKVGARAWSWNRVLRWDAKCTLGREQRENGDCDAGTLAHGCSPEEGARARSHATLDFFRTLQATRYPTVI